MNWSIRHSGSPKTVTNLTAAQIADGLLDGHWESTDEVRGPADREWRTLELHPEFASVVEEFDEAAADSHPADDHLDMNPLIDVCLVLLVFFILTTTVQALHRVLESPRSVVDRSVPRQVSEPELDRIIRVSLYRENGRDIIKVGDRVVADSALRAELVRAARELDRPRDRVLIDARGVQWGTVVKIIDAAGGANIRRVMLQSPPARGSAPGRFL